MARTAPLTKEELTELLKTNDKAVAHAIVRLYERQTQDERQLNTTTKHNGIGFRQCDAYRLTQYAKLLLAGKTLQDFQVKYARPRVLHYTRQLLEIAAEQANRKQAA